MKVSSVVAGKCNPADLGSRGVSTRKLLDSENWKNEPFFLRKSQDHWPQKPYISLEIHHDDPEIKKERIILATSIATNNPTQKLIESSSSLEKLY